MTDNQNGLNSFEPENNNGSNSNDNTNNNIFNNTWQNNTNQNPAEGAGNNQFQNQQPPFSYTWDGSAYNGVGSNKPRKNRGLKAFAATVTICLVLVLSMVGWALYMGYVPTGTNSEDSSADGNSKDAISVAQIIKVSENNVEYTNKLTEVYDKIKNSCVSVITDKSLGSGFIVKEDGYIITNHHVIESAKTIKVQFYSKDEYTAKLIGSDSVSDIAVLKIEGTFTPIELGNSDSLKVGQDVVAVGTPYDLSLAGTMSRGIISGIARNVEVTNDSGIVVKTMTLIQTDTSINPGNSGGPLINLDGQVIGINTLKLMQEYEGLGFSIPINNAVTIANTLIQYGKVEERPNDDFVTATPRLNVTVMNVSDYLNTYETNFSVDLPEGAVVTAVARNSSIYKAGLELYDIITEFDGKEIKSKEDLTSQLKNKRAGDTVTIKVFRVNRNGDGGQYHELSFKLDSAK
jgi:serine protease Do